MKCLYLHIAIIFSSTLMKGMEQIEVPIAPSVPVRLQLYDQTKLTSYRTVTVPVEFVDLCTTLKEMRSDFGEQPLPITPMLSHVDWQAHIHPLLKKLVFKQDVRPDIKMNNNGALKKIAYVATFLNCKELEDPVLGEIASRLKSPETIKLFIEKPSAISKEFELNPDQEKVVARKMGNDIWFDAHVFTPDACYRAASICFSPNGRHIAVGSYDGSIDFFDISSEQCVYTFYKANADIADCVQCIYWGPDDQRLVAYGSNIGTVSIFNAGSGECISTFYRGSDGHLERVNSICFSPDGKRIISGSSDQSIKIFDVALKQCVHTFDQIGRIADVCFDLNSKFIACSFGNSIKFFDVASKQCMHTLDESNGIDAGALCICFSPDGKYIATGSSEGVIRVFNIASRECVYTFDAKDEGHTNCACHANCTYDVCFSPDGQFIASRSCDGIMKVFDISSQQCVFTFDETDDVYTGNCVRCVSFSPDGDYIAVGLIAGLICVKKPTINTVPQALLCLNRERNGNSLSIEYGSTMAPIYNSLVNTNDKTYIGSLIAKNYPVKNNRVDLTCPFYNSVW
ncbi:MAG: WD40 repeat domain-containing protein [Candidatus Babeliales bacterium]